MSGSDDGAPSLALVDAHEIDLELRRKRRRRGIAARRAADGEIEQQVVRLMEPIPFLKRRNSLRLVVAC
jgi:hypothetical protein